jgi:hypothetical protein
MRRFLVAVGSTAWFCIATAGFVLTVVTAAHVGMWAVTLLVVKPWEQAA